MRQADTQPFFDFLNHLPIAALVLSFRPDQTEKLSEQKIRFVNQKFLDLIGYTTDDIPDSWRWMQTAYPDPDYCREISQLWKERAAEALENDEAVARAKVKVRCKSGQDRWFEVFSELRSTIRPGYYIMTFIDITDLTREMEGLKHLSSVDQLTGTYNQHYIIQRIEQEIDRALNTATGFSLVMCDLDFFKSVNDRYGHNCGDYVLVKTAELLRNALTGMDCVARWNGADFLILMREDNAEIARRLVEKAWQTLRTHSFDWEGHSFAMTMTMGITTYRPGDQGEALIERVDSALQRGKQVGGDFIFVDDQTS